jgi:2-(1,2-epoxy-1,2-dihydrophenyl)acetyl-CoA isomerase
MSNSTLLLALADGVATVTLNRPDKLNSFTPELHAELAETLDRIAKPESGVRALIITGAGRGFCAGQDLSLRDPTVLHDLRATLQKQFNPNIRRVRALPMPVIAAVNGVAAGAGMSLALACDIVIAATGASFLQAFAKIGLIPDSGSTYFLPRLAGDARARALAILAEKITAQQARDWGLIWQVVDDDKLMDEARAMAARLAQMPTRAIALIKQALDATPGNSLDGQLDLEAELQGIAGRSEDYREGVAAFLEKRAPRFTGR